MNEKQACLFCEDSSVKIPDEIYGLCEECSNEFLNFIPKKPSTMKLPETAEQPTGKGLNEMPCQPKRIWRRRIKGWKMPPNTVSVCRPGKWGNPFKPEDFRFAISSLDGETEVRRRTDSECHAEAVAVFENWFPEEKIEEARRELRGKNLACFCRPGTPCHADVLLRIANLDTSKNK